MTLLLALACAHDEPIDTAPPVDPGSSNYSANLGDEPDFTRATSTFAMDWWLAWGQAQLVGSFSKEPMPALRTEHSLSGQCRLMTWEPSNCGTTCPGWCVDGECLEFPERYSEGEATWTWPDGETVVGPDEGLTYMAVAEATTMGESSLVLDALSLTVPTVEPVELTEADPFSGRARGDDVTLAWGDPVDGARVRLFMTDCAGSHGGIGESEIECEGPDIGSITLPGVFLDALEDGDWSRGECGSHTLDRYHASASEDGELRLESAAPIYVYWFPGL